MSNRPFANVLAVRDEDPERLTRLVAELESDPRIDRVLRPAHGWVAATAELPGGPAERTAQGPLFFEGRDVIEAYRPSDGENPMAVVGRLAESSPERLAELPGDFGFFHFGAHGTITAVRSAAGLVPVYVYQGRRRTILSTRLGDVATHADRRLEIDPLVNAIWASLETAFPDQRTFFRDVHILPAGHAVQIRAGGPPETIRYWDPRAHSGSDLEPSPDHAKQLRSLLLRTLERDLDREGRNLLLLSSGVDSSSLGALIAGALGRGTSTLTFFSPGEDLRSRNGMYLQGLARELDFSRRLYVRATDEAMLRLVHAAPRVVFYPLAHAFGLLPSLQRAEGTRVVIGGEFADQVCGSPSTFPDWARHTPLSWLLSGRARLPRGPVDFGVWAKRRLADLRRRPVMPMMAELPTWAHPAVRAEYREWWDRRRRNLADDRRPMRTLASQQDVSGFVPMWWEGAAPLGVRRSFPFHTREMLELANRMHPAELIGPGFKRILREALAGDVPAPNLLRPDKDSAPGSWQELQDLSSRRLPAVLEPVLAPAWFPRPPSAVSTATAIGFLHLEAFAAAVATPDAEPIDREQFRTVDGLLRDLPPPG